MSIVVCIVLVKHLVMRKHANLLQISYDTYVLHLKQTGTSLYITSAILEVKFQLSSGLVGQSINIGQVSNSNCVLPLINLLHDIIITKLQLLNSHHNDPFIHPTPRQFTTLTTSGPVYQIVVPQFSVKTFSTL